MFCCSSPNENRLYKTGSKLELFCNKIKPQWWFSSGTWNQLFQANRRIKLIHNTQDCISQNSSAVYWSYLFLEVLYSTLRMGLHDSFLPSLWVLPEKKRLNGEFSLFHLNLSYVYVHNFLIKKPLSSVWACSSLYNHWTQVQDPKYSGKDWEWITYSCKIKLAHTHTHTRTHTANPHTESSSIMNTPDEGYVCWLHQSYISLIDGESWLKGSLTVCGFTFWGKIEP